MFANEILTSIAALVLYNYKIKVHVTLMAVRLEICQKKARLNLYIFTYIHNKYEEY